MSKTNSKARIEVFRPGSFRPMGGSAISYSAADLRAIADAYDPEIAPAPIVIGHPAADAPAFGWAERFEYDQGADRLWAELSDIEPAFAGMVKAGRFRKVSMAYFSPDAPHNPVPGIWYPKHIGFLGAAAPAVSGLRNVKFAAPADAVFTAAFGEPGFEETAGLFRALREFFIDRFGIEDTDQALPAWRIEWLNEIELNKPNHGELHPSYSEDAKPTAIDPTPNPEPEKEKAVKTQPDPAFADREAEIDRREKAIADRERAAAHDDNVSFAESLVGEGRLIPASKDKVVAILDTLPTDATVSFSEGGDKLSPVAAIRDVLKAQPKIVSYDALELPDEGTGGRSTASAAFAADGRAVDPAGLAIHQKALAYQRSNPGTDYIDAVHAVS